MKVYKYPLGYMYFCAGYLGEEDKSVWAKHDPTDLIQTLSSESIPYDDILIDVGTSDNFLSQLRPEVNLPKYSQYYLTGVKLE